MRLDVVIQTVWPYVGAVRVPVERDDFVTFAKLTTFSGLHGAARQLAIHETGRRRPVSEVGCNERTFLDVPTGIYHVGWVRPLEVVFAAPESNPRPSCHATKWCHALRD